MNSESSDDFVDLDVTNSSANDTDYDIYEYELEESFSNFNWSELGPNVAIFAITFVLGMDLWRYGLNSYTLCPNQLICFT